MDTVENCRKVLYVQLMDLFAAKVPDLLFSLKQQQNIICYEPNPKYSTSKTIAREACIRKGTLEFMVPDKTKETSTHLYGDPGDLWVLVCKREDGTVKINTGVISESGYPANVNQETTEEELREWIPNKDLFEVMVFRGRHDKK